MQRAEDQVARFSSRHGGGDCREIAHFADEHDVRILTQGAAERFGEVRNVYADFALHHDRLFMLVVIFDRVFHRDDMAIEVLVDVVYHRGKSRRLAGTGRPGHQEDTARAAADLLGHLGEADRIERENLVRNLTQYERG